MFSINDSNFPSTNSSVNDTSSDDENIIITLSDDENSNDTESTGSYESDYDYDTEEDDLYDLIHNVDSQHFYSEKENDKYYIGLYHRYYTPEGNSLLLLSTSVSSPIFFSQSYDNINNYLYYYGIVRIPNHEVQIMKTHYLPDNTCTVIVKTFWLRIVQRRWKKIYAIRKTIINKRCMPYNISYNQIHGCYPFQISTLPSIRGMLTSY
jgi:hypothetical protein